LRTWLYRLTVRTDPSHGSNRGSIPRRVTNSYKLEKHIHMRYLPDDNLSYPIRLTLDDGSFGSGFYLNFNGKDLYIVTARHVLCKEEDGKYVIRTNKIKVLSYDGNTSINEPYIYELDFYLLPNENIIISDSYDVVVVKIGSLKEVEGERSKYNISFVGKYTSLNKPNGDLSGIVFIPSIRFKKYEEIFISNDVIIFGYPASLGSGSEIDYNRPLLRKGIVAGKNLNNRTVILDCPSYQGNSGGVVLEVDPVTRKTHPIGIVSSFVPFIEKFKSIHFGYTNTSVENSGYSIITPIDVILTLISS
jgi:hypothetical protein